MAAKEPADAPPWVAEVLQAVEEARERTERKVEEISTSILKELRATEVRQEEALQRAMALRRKATSSALERAALSHQSTKSSAACAVPVAVGAQGPLNHVSSGKLDNLEEESDEQKLPEDAPDAGRGPPASLSSFKTQHADTCLSLNAARVDVAEILGLDHLVDSKKGRNNRPSTWSASSAIANIKPATHIKNCLISVVKSPRFDQFCAVVIILNSFALSMQADQQAANIRSPDEHSLSRQTWTAINLCFVSFFVCELGARMLVHKKEFFNGSDRNWNLFDLLVVTLALAEELTWVFFNDSLMAASKAQVLRLLRVVRIIRTLRVVRFLRDLRIMLSSITSAIVPFFWACILLLVIHWCFGMYFVLASTDFIETSVESEGREWLENGRVKRLQKHFGTVSHSIYTLFLSITGGIDWGEDAAPSLLDIGPITFFLYVLFIALTLFAVLNIVTAVFVNNATKTAMEDRDLVIQQTLEKEEQYIKNAFNAFAEADEDSNQKVTWEEFQKSMQDPRVVAFFSTLELTGLEARRLFRLLDLNGDGHVDADEFISGCMCLRGHAKTLDTATLIFEQRKEARRLHDFMHYVEDQFALINMDPLDPLEGVGSVYAVSV